MDIVLHSRRHDDVDFAAPRFFAREEFDAEFIGIVLDAVAAAVAHFDDVVDLFLRSDAVRVIDVAVRTGQSNDFGTQFRSFLADAPGYVAEAGSGDSLAFDVLAVVFENVFQEVYGAVARSFRTDAGTAEAEAFAREDTVFEAAFQAAVFAEEVADFTAADAHVPSRYVDIRTDVAIESLHIALAETHDFSVGLARRVEVSPAFGAADRQAGQCVLENLFKAQEFDDA